MPYDLKGRNVLVTGGSRGLGALICEKFAAEGCNVAINYLSSEGSAKEVAAKVEEHSVKSIIVQGDASLAADNSRMIRTVVEKFGGLDIVIANAGWTKFSKFGDLSALTDDEWNKCWATNVMCHLQVVREIMPIFNGNPDGGVYLMTSSVAGIMTGGSSMAYSVTKSAALHLMKCLASTQGPKLRINAVLPGLLLTEWGLRYPPEMIQIAKDRAALKEVTLLDDCADAFISTAKNSSMTGAQIKVDAGYFIG